MKQTINLSQFCDAFKDMGREEQFSYEGKKALFDYIEEIEENTGEEIELDVIALCCEFTEYKDLKELQGYYNEIETMEDLEKYTQVIPIKGTKKFIIQDY